MDKINIEQSLNDFQAQLPEKPEWIILVRADGEFVGRIGEYHFFIRKQLMIQPLLSGLMLMEFTYLRL